MRQRTNRGARGLRARLTMGAIGVGFFVALSAPVAHADTCAPLDVECIAQQGGDTVGGVVDKTKDVIDKTKDTLGGTVGGAVDKGKDTVGSILNQTGAGGGSGGGTGGGTGGAGGGTGGRHHHHGSAGSRTSHGITSTLNPVTSSTTPDQAAKAKLVSHHAPPSVLRSIGGTVVRTAKQLSFPIVLALLVGLFIAVQNRMDRHDPKLALAPLTPDRMRFV